jgi:hypothetical protein
MKRFKNILCVVGSEKAGRQAIERAVTLAVNNQANLSVVVEAADHMAGSGMQRPVHQASRKASR